MLHHVALQMDSFCHSLFAESQVKFILQIQISFCSSGDGEHVPQ